MSQSYNLFRFDNDDGTVTHVATRPSKHIIDKSVCGRLLVTKLFKFRNHILKVVPKVTFIFKFREIYHGPSLLARFTMPGGNELPNVTPAGVFRVR
jgi:hypothetical protein